MHSTCSDPSHLHITPGFSVHVVTHMDMKEVVPGETVSKDGVEPKDPESPLNIRPSADPARIAKHAVSLMGDAIIRASAQVQTNNLTPASDIRCFNKCVKYRLTASSPGNELNCVINRVTVYPSTSITFYNVAWDSNGNYWAFASTSEYRGYKSDWNVTFYCYATGADPTEANFSSNGGRIYVVAVHGGQVQRDGYYANRHTVPDETMYFFLPYVRHRMEDTSNLTRASLQYPDNSDDQSQNNNHDCGCKNHA
jgi:hypothetical protein